MTKIRLVNTAGTPITRAIDAKLSAEYVGYNTKEPSKVVQEEIVIEEADFENGNATFDFTLTLAKMDVVKELKVTADIEKIGFYMTSSVTYKVSKDCENNPKYVDYDTLIAKLNGEKKTLEIQLEAAAKAGDEALVAQLKDQIGKLEDQITDADKEREQQEKNGIQPIVCEMNGIPTKMSIPLNQITRTPEQQESRREAINAEITASAVKKLRK